VTLPALRHRKGDVKILTEHFLKKYLGAQAPQLPVEVLNALQAYQWPGNIRELQNAVERAAILSSGRTLEQRDFLLTDNVLANVAGGAPSLRESIDIVARPEGSEEIQSVITEDENLQDSLQIIPGMTVHEVERTLIIETLKANDDNRTQAAKSLGISIRTLRNKLNEYREQGFIAR